MPGIDLPTRYDASTVEQKWYARWEQAGLFQPEPNSAKSPYVITIPPPNITGSLHMGHALCYPIQDLIGRYQRLRGRNVLILPGQDHAGIATQSVVEKQLKKEGLSGAQLGREKFVERVWQWRKESGDTIIRQFRRLGMAYDWTRLRFTLDPAYAEAVLKVFIDWFERGLIYKGYRVVNWDPVLQTSVSDIETERKTQKGKLYYIRYPLVGGPGHITIATTRPETMLADVAVAVHPSDERYKRIVGKKVLLPLMNREIPVLADIYADPAFGTGAVKITPAHDPNDYQVGLRHSLPMPVLLDSTGKITPEGGVYGGLDRYEARKRIVADLEELGFLDKTEDHDIPILVSERSGVAIEPLLSEQWFVEQKQLAKPAIEAVKQGKIRFTPDRYERIYLEWMENIRDWNISRQLWWGHRIPVYYDEAGTAYAALSWEEAVKKADGKKIVKQENDVLDTWFSSALWPFATLGWPQQTEDLKRYYPTHMLVTDRNILYLWVARMIMDGLDFMGDIPFHEVYIHATVLTEDGRRMSKSLGTGVDPIEVIDNIGADALRHTLLSQTGYNQDIRYSERRTEESRNFCNKIWNAVRFTLLNVEAMPPKPEKFEPVDLWILSRLAATESTVREAYDRYDIQVATQALQRFFWGELCDWYIEIAKQRLNDPESRATPQWVLIESIRAFVTMLHPVMPHITEEVFSYLPKPESKGETTASFLMASKWPDIPDWYSNSEAELYIERTFAVTRTLRALRFELDISPGVAIPLAYYEGELGSGVSIIAAQAWVQQLEEGRPRSGKFVSSSIEGIDLHLPIEGFVNVEKKVERLKKELENSQAELKQLEERLGNPQFAERAKLEAVEKTKLRAQELQELIAKLRERLSLFEK